MRTEPEPDVVKLSIPETFHSITICCEVTSLLQRNVGVETALQGTSTLLTLSYFLKLLRDCSPSAAAAIAESPTSEPVLPPSCSLLPRVHAHSGSNVHQPAPVLQILAKAESRSAQGTRENRNAAHLSFEAFLAEKGLCSPFQGPDSSPHSAA